MKYPILANNGRVVLHYATNETSAKRWLMKNVLSDQSINLIRQHNFTLNVWLREDWLVDLNGGVKGWMYSIGK